MDRFLPSITIVAQSVGEDILVTAKLAGEDVGWLKVRVLPLVYDLEIRPGMTQRRVADALVHFVSGFCQAIGFQEALFTIDEQNESMQSYMVTHGAIAEPPRRVYMMGTR